MEKEEYFDKLREEDRVLLEVIVDECFKNGLSCVAKGSSTRDNDRNYGDIDLVVYSEKGANVDCACFLDRVHEKLGGKRENLLQEVVKESGGYVDSRAEIIDSRDKFTINDSIFDIVCVDPYKAIRKSKDKIRVFNPSLSDVFLAEGPLLKMLGPFLKGVAFDSWFSTERSKQNYTEN